MKLTILIVDDNEDIRFSVKDSLSALDNSYSFIEADSGESCLKILTKKIPDLILMDIMMPGKDGTQTAVEIKENSKTRNIPILFLTAKIGALSKAMGKIIGKDYIEKPFDPEDLDERIKYVIRNDNL